MASAHTQPRVLGPAWGPLMEPQGQGEEACVWPGIWQEPELQVGGDPLLPQAGGKP